MSHTKDKASKSSSSKAKKIAEKEQPQVLPENGDPSTHAVDESKKNRKKRKVQEDADESEAAPKKSKKSKKSKSQKGQPKEDEVMQDVEEQPAVAEENGVDDEHQDGAADKEQKEVAKKEKKEKKAKKDKKEKKEKKAAKKEKKAETTLVQEESTPKAADGETAQSTEDSSEEPKTTENGVESPEDAATGKREKFICFIGNLPYTATKEEIEKHFEKVPPTSVRIMTDKKTGKARGFAFIEFDRYDRMKTCLAKYQHSLFADGGKGRKINVELTAGGGGNTEERKEKIRAKNTKLQDERQRQHEQRDEIEAKQKDRKMKKEQRAKKANESKGGSKTNALAELEASAKGQDDSESAPQESGMHPARLAMLQKTTANTWKPHRTRF